MNRIKTYLREFRYQQWIKNFVVFLPAFFGGRVFDPTSIYQASLAFVIFSVSASLVYLINDYKDIPEDRKHPEKKHRPLASGEIKPREAQIVSFVLLIFVIAGLLWISQPLFSLIIGTYLVVNLIYSLGLKKVPVVELFVVAAFYVLRLAGGGILAGVEVSIWLYLIIFSGSLLFVCGKRLTEKRNSNTRFVLQYYSEKMLFWLLLFCAAASCIFIFFYTLNQGLLYLPQAIIFSLAIARYVYLVEKTALGESMKILFDKMMVLLIGIFILYTVLIIYLI